MNKAKLFTKKALSILFGRSIDRLSVTTKYVSFDIFDTLVLRNCEKPSDVFKLVTSGTDDFYEARINAEREARQKSPFEEITLDEIYANLNSVFGVKNAEQLKHKEIEAEIAICVPNQEVVDKLNEMVAQGRSVFLISDMYLPKTVIQNILNKCGIRGYKKLYVSSEYRKTKRSGNLFKQVLSENGIIGDQLVHIGDNPLSDYIVARKVGMRAFLYQNLKK